MLTLTRRLGERVFIGGDVVVEVVSVDRGKIRLGITAPPDKIILREELIARAAPPGEGGPHGAEHGD